MPTYRCASSEGNQVKNTVTQNEFINGLEEAHAGFSYDGAAALYDYLTQYEDDCGTEIEFDPVGIRCEYSEYGSAVEAAEDCTGWRRTELVEPDEIQDWDRDEAQNELDDANEAEALEYLRDRTQVVEFSGGIVICTEF